MIDKINKTFKELEFAINNTIVEKEGEKLFSCAECGGKVELMEKVKFEISEDEKKKEMENEYCMPGIDFYRYKWTFKPCRKCNTLTTVTTEIDRY